MKLAFSTLGCPEWTWSDIYATAKDLNFDGIEVRGVANELYVPKAKRFTAEKIDGTIKKLNDGNIEIPMLTTGIAVGEILPNAVEEAFSQAKEYIDLAKKLSCPYIRIMISSHPQPEEVNLAQAVDLYNRMCEYGEGKNVTPLMETNGILANSQAMAEFMQEIKSENKGVLWDIHHPVRFFDESVDETYSYIGNLVKYVHVKDSVMHDGTILYRMMGYGTIPVFDALKILKDNGYDGYISLEWVKRWNPDLEGAGIVFAHFMSYITFLLGRL